MTDYADWIYSVAVRAESNRFATGSYDGQVRIRKIIDGTTVRDFVAVPRSIHVARPTRRASAERSAGHVLFYLGEHFQERRLALPVGSHRALERWCKYVRGCHSLGVGT